MLQKDAMQRATQAFILFLTAAHTSHRNSYFAYLKRS